MNVSGGIAVLIDQHRHYMRVWHPELKIEVADSQGQWRRVVAEDLEPAKSKMHSALIFSFPNSFALKLAALPADDPINNEIVIERSSYQNLLSEFSLFLKSIAGPIGDTLSFRLVAAGQDPRSIFRDFSRIRATDSRSPASASVPDMAMSCDVLANFGPANAYVEFFPPVALEDGMDLRGSNRRLLLEQGEGVFLYPTIEYEIYPQSDTLYTLILQCLSNLGI